MSGNDMTAPLARVIFLGDYRERKAAAERSWAPLIEGGRAITEARTEERADALRRDPAAEWRGDPALAQREWRPPRPPVTGSPWVRVTKPKPRPRPKPVRHFLHNPDSTTGKRTALCGLARTVTGRATTRDPSQITCTHCALILADAIRAYRARGQRRWGDEVELALLDRARRWWQGIGPRRAP